MKKEILLKKEITEQTKQMFVQSRYQKDFKKFLKLSYFLKFAVFLLFCASLYSPSFVSAQTLDYSFVVLGCNRVNPADSAGNPSTANTYQLNRLFTEVSQMNPLPKYLFFAGDLVLGYENDTVKLESQLANWLNLYKASPLFGTSVQLVALEGNHETQDKAAGKKSFPAAERTFLRVMHDYILGNNGPAITGLAPGTDSLTTDQSQLTYSFNYKKDHFVLINTDPVGRDAITSYKWIANDIKNARAAGARHVFAIGHKPAYSGRFVDAPDGLDVNAAQRDSLWSTLEQYQADAFFSAHIHASDTVQPHVSKTWQIIAGNGGSMTEASFAALPHSYFGYVVADVYTNNQVHVNNMGRDANMTDSTYLDAAPDNPTTVRASYDIGINPVIDQTPLTNTSGNGPFAVVATITDNVAVTNAQLNYRVNGVAQTPLSPAMSGNMYTFTIPAQSNLGIISYNIQANDSSLVKIYSAGDSAAYTTFTYGPSTGISSSQSPYILPVAPGVNLTSILTANDSVGGYKMSGTPDGLGAFDNGDGTFTLLMDHEFVSTAGIVRAHGSKGSFVSKLIINKSNLSVISGSDLIQKIYLWDTVSNSFRQDTTSFSRFCSADLPPVSAFYNNTTGLGTQERIFMNGEENSFEGRAFGHIATGVNAGTSYQLPYLGKFAWENSVASPTAGDKTVVAGMDDGPGGQVYFYIGTKTNAGTEIDKAGLNNGKSFGVSVAGMPKEDTSGVPGAGTRFTLADLGSVQNKTGGALDTASAAAGVTTFLRPEDGAWDPSNLRDFYFNTTDAFALPSRLWRLRFDDPANPELGGTIEAVLDGTEGQKMLDNMAIDKYGHILLLEDVGNNPHLGKVWQYTIATDKLVELAQHDSSRFLTGGANFLTEDEESSGIIDAENILGPGMFLLVTQAHFKDTINPGIVEGGQLMSLFNPDSYGSALPLTFVSFAGKLINDKTQLNWQTANEINTRYFEIERSNDGTHFAQIGVINAMSRGSNNYNTIDVKPQTGNNYYRLKIVDKDGKFTYSAILLVRVSAKGKLEFVMYPNPAKDVLVIATAGTVNPVQFDIYTQQGQKVMSKKISAATTALSVAHLPKGLYIVKLSSGADVQVKKLIRD